MSDTTSPSDATTERHGATTAIDIAPQRPPGWNRIRRLVRASADWLHLIFASAIVVGVFVQVYLIGAYIFGAGQGALDAHETVGFTAHGFEVLVFVAAVIAWLPWRDLLLSLLLAVVGTGQVALAGEHRWVGGLHPLLALVVFVLAATLARRAIRRRRQGRLAHHDPFVHTRAGTVARSVNPFRSIVSPLLKMTTPSEPGQNMSWVRKAFVFTKLSTDGDRRSPATVCLRSDRDKHASG
jgi:hypothetical protein